MGCICSFIRIALFILYKMYRLYHSYHIISVFSRQICSWLTENRAEAENIAADCKFVTEIGTTVGPVLTAQIVKVCAEQKQALLHGKPAHLSAPPHPV